LTKYKGILSNGKQSSSSSSLKSIEKTKLNVSKTDTATSNELKKAKLSISDYKSKNRSTEVPITNQNINENNIININNSEKAETLRNNDGKLKKQK
jgi:hypothetical protein